MLPAGEGTFSLLLPPPPPPPPPSSLPSCPLPPLNCATLSATWFVGITSLPSPPSPETTPPDLIWESYDTLAKLLAFPPLPA